METKYIFTSRLFVLLVQVVEVTSEMKVYVDDNVNSGKGMDSIVDFTCSGGEWIHIVSAQTSTCSGVYCTKDTMTPYSIGELTHHCTGQQSCTEPVYIPPDAVKLEITYECLKVNCLNLCEIPVKTLTYRNSVDIHTPRSPDRQRGQCDIQCTFTGRGMSVTFYQYEVQRKASFTLVVIADGVAESVEPRRVFPRYDGPQDVNTLIVTYDNKGMDDQDIWMRVTDNGSMQVKCHSLSSTTTTSAPGPAPVGTDTQWKVPESDLADGDTFKQDKNETSSDTDDTGSTLIGDLLGGLLALIVVLIIALAITIFFCKKKKAAGSSNNEESMSQVTKPPNAPPRPQVTSPQVTSPQVTLPQPPAPGQCKEDDYLTPISPFKTTPPPPVYDQLEQHAYLELDGPGEYIDLEVYDTIRETTSQEYTTPYSTS